MRPSLTAPAGVPASLMDVSAQKPIVLCVSASEEIASSTCDADSIVYWNPSKRQFQTSDSTAWVTAVDFIKQLDEQGQEHQVFELFQSLSQNGGSARYTPAGIDVSVGSTSTLLKFGDEVGR